MFQLNGFASKATDVDSSIVTVAKAMILVYFWTYLNSVFFFLIYCDLVCVYVFNVFCSFGSILSFYLFIY